MKCIEYSELISAYVDEMLNPQEEEKLIEHLKTCQRCQEELESFKQIKRMCSQIKEVSLPDTFHKQLMQSIKNERQAGSFIKWKWQYGGALVATLLVGVLFLNQLNFKTSQNETATDDVTQNQVAEARVKDQTSTTLYEDHLGSRAFLNEETDYCNVYKVQVEQSDDFIQELKAYLEKEYVIYEVTQSGIRIYELQENQELIKWLKAHSISFEGDEDTFSSNIQLEIQ